ncbi:DNA-binding protein [Devosia sp.]|uniref:DNA-binding protein n=1 Tax=Devosia sp. TaxID=1871048 RepID=UPI0032677EE3
MSVSPEPENLDLLWGCKIIAQVIGCTERKTFHLLESGALPARRVGGTRWVASRKALEAFFAEVAA